MFDSKRKDVGCVSSKLPFIVDMDQIDRHAESMIKLLVADGFCIIINYNCKSFDNSPKKNFQYLNKVAKHGKYPINIISDCANLENYPLTASEHVNLQAYNHFCTADSISNDSLEQKSSERVSNLFDKCSKLINEELIPRISMKITGKYTSIENFTTTNSYSFLDGFQKDENNTGILVDSSLLLTIYKFKSGSKLKIITKTNPSCPAIYTHDRDTEFYLLSIGKSLEILTKGLLFNNVLKIENGDTSEEINEYFVLSKHLDFNRSFHNYLQKLDDHERYSELFSRYDEILKKRFWNINRNSMRQIREKLFSIYGYTKTDIDFLRISEEYTHIDFNLENDFYLVSFNFQDSIGKFVWYNVAFKNNDQLLEKVNLDFMQHLNSFLEYKLSKITKYFEKLLKILMSLDNLLFIYFMNHVNFPPFNSFLIKLSKILNFKVSIYDILAIKVIYLDSYNLIANKIKKTPLNSSRAFHEDLDFLIGFNDENFNLNTFKEERKLRLTELITKFKRKFFLDYENKDIQKKHNKSQILKIFHNLDGLTIELNSKMDALISSIEEQGFSENRITTNFKNTESLLKSNKKLLINKITEKNKSSNVIDTSSKISKLNPEIKTGRLSLIERIKLKQAENSKKLMLLKDSTSKTNFKELYYVVFTILANLNSKAVFTSTPISSLVDTICRSVINNHTMAISDDTVRKVLYHFNDILSDDLFQIVNLSGIASGSIIVKFNFHNKREEILRCINK